MQLCCIVWIRTPNSRSSDVKGYAWFTFDQVNWYRSQSAAYTERNGGKPLPALAFFHIPLPEYNQAALMRVPY